jgi:hypothetical protein
LNSCWMALITHWAKDLCHVCDKSQAFAGPELGNLHIDVEDFQPFGSYPKIWTTR